VDIEFVVGDAGLRRWHSRLAEYLVELPGVALWTTLAPGRPRFCTVDLLYRLEGLIYGVAPGHPAEPVGAMPGRPMDRGDAISSWTSPAPTAARRCPCCGCGATGPRSTRGR
jgi:hypothetical protein